jgi:hypothetical protein
MFTAEGTHHFGHPLSFPVHGPLVEWVRSSLPVLRYMGDVWALGSVDRPRTGEENRDRTRRCQHLEHVGRAPHDGVGHGPW